jgi:spermidine synthase
MVLTLQRNFAQVTPMLVSVPMSGGQWLMAMASHVAQHPLEEEACGAQLAELRDPALRLITPKVAKSLLALPPYLARALAF